MLCKICDSAAAPVVFQLNGSGVRVRRCRECGFTFVDHRVVESRLESSEHDAAGVLDADPRYSAKFSERLALVESTCGRVGGKRVLDVGAGGGGWLAVARDAGAEVEGIEFCETCRGYARSQRGLVLDTRPLEDAYWQSRSAAFDLVSAWDVFEHVNEPKEFLASCTGLLKPGGKLLLSTPVRDTWFDWMGEAGYHATLGRAQFLLRQRYSHAHLQIFHSRQLRELLRGAGLRELYYRKVQELSFRPEQYFRNIYGSSPAVAPLGKLAGTLLRTLPLANKVIGIFEKT